MAGSKSMLCALVAEAFQPSPLCSVPWEAEPYGPHQWVSCPVASISVWSLWTPTVDQGERKVTPGHLFSWLPPQEVTWSWLSGPGLKVLTPIKLSFLNDWLLPSSGIAPSPCPLLPRVVRALFLLCYPLWFSYTFPFPW